MFSKAFLAGSLNSLLIVKDLKTKYSGQVICLDQSEASIQIMGSVLTNQRPVLCDRPLFWTLQCLKESKASERETEGVEYEQKQYLNKRDRQLRFGKPRSNFLNQEKLIFLTEIHLVTFKLFSRFKYVGKH